MTRGRAPWVLPVVLALSVWRPFAAQAPAGRQFYASPTGVLSSDGSMAHPLDLPTALSVASPLRAGDTLWLRGGRYLGNYTSFLTGAPGAPIIVRQYAGERATIDAATPNRSLPGLTVNGADTWYWGFEVTDTNPSRVNAGGFNTPPLRATSVDVFGPRTRFINMVVHDGLQGFGFWSPAIDAEIYGSVIFNVGVEAPDRGHGHSVYVQNATGWKRIVDNIMFHGFSFGIHAYTEGGRVDNIHMEGNTVFGHGLLSPRSGAKANVVTGGGDIADFTRVLNNYSYYPTLEGRGLDLDYGNGCQSPDIRGNYAAAGEPVKVARCTNVTMTGNTWYGSTGTLASQFPNNTYYATRPTGVRTFVRPNAYEGGRANITIFNWDLQSTVAVDVSSANLPSGTRYEVRDAQNFFGPPVATGAYSGNPIAIPMTNLVAALPVGNVPVVLPHTAPQFGAFVLLPVASTAPAPPRIDSVSPISGPAAGGVTVTITGSGFGVDSTVLFGNVSATGVVVLSNSTLTVTAPPHAPAAVDLVLTTAGRQATRPAGFRYQPMPPLLRPAVVIAGQLFLEWDAGSATPVRGYGLVGGVSPGGSEYGPYSMGLATRTSAAVGPGRYYARVIADTDWGLLTSNEIAFAVGVPEPPGVPGLAPAAVNGTTVTLSWSAVSGSPTAYVVVARYSAAGPLIATLPVAGTTLTVAAPPGVYFVTVVALNSQGVSAESNQVVVVVP